jgi:peptidoglycan/xylan/chitin deacetylase (PgdA/CDA1 family)
MRETGFSVFLRRLSGVFFLAALVLVMVTWIQISRPFDPGQSVVPNVVLDASLKNEARNLPVYPGSVVALTYHGVSDIDHSGNTLTRARFAQHLDALKAAGYQTVKLADVQALVAGDKPTLPKKALLLTFDGGHMSDWTNVDPMLKKYGFNAVAFLTTSKIVQKGTPSYFLSTDKVQKMRDTGRWEFGSHSHNLSDNGPIKGDFDHAFSNRIMVDGKEETVDQWAERLAKDLAKSQKFFKEELGAPAKSFAVPFGDPSTATNIPPDPTIGTVKDRVEKIVKDAGFSTAFYGENVPYQQVDALVKKSQDYQLPRIGVRATTSVWALLQMIKGTIPSLPPTDLLPLPWDSDGLSGVKCTKRAKYLVVSSADYGICKVDSYNTSQWRDYVVTFKMAPLKVPNSAIVRVRDGIGAGHKGFVEVAIGAGHVEIQQRTRDDEDDAPRLDTARLGPIEGRFRLVTISVIGNKITVEVTGAAKTLNADISEKLYSGGVQFGVAGKSKSHSVAYGNPRLTAKDIP